MKTFPVLFLSLLVTGLQAATTWDGGAGDGLFHTAGNWDDDQVPSSLFVNPLFPAAAPNKQVDLGGNGVAHERIILQGGYRILNGRIGVAGGGPNSEIESSGDNTLDASFGTFEWGNDVKLIQHPGGNFIVNGGTSGFMKSLVIRAEGTITLNGTVAPFNGYAFYKEGTGLARVNGQVNGSNGGRFVTRGTLLLNGSSSADAPWTVNGGRLGGTGTFNSDVTLGATLGSVVSPGDPASAGGIGTLTVNGAVNLGENTTLEVDLGAAGTSDRLAISGALAIGSRTGLWVKTATTPGGSYTIITHGGPRTGSFVLLDAPAGARIDESVAGEVRIVIDPPPLAENIVFPAGANVVNVTQPPYNAIPNDGLDDTAAIQAALDAFPNGRRIIYLPNGVYHVSNTLSWPAGIPGWTDYKHTILQGQSRNGAVLRLIDNAPLFQNPAARRAVLYTGPAPAQRFGIEIRTLTVDTGNGNPGASGIQFNANNFGGVKKVLIRSGDGQGVSGLDMHFTAEIGPLLVQDLEIHGFDHGIRTADVINGIVLERIIVRGQNIAGVLNAGQVFSMRGFTSINSVPALIAGTNPFGGLDTGGATTLLDARLIGLPGAENQNAITTAAFFYGRNIISTGYARVLSKPTLNGNANLDAASIDEYQSRSILSLFPSPARSLNMPVEDPPLIPADPVADWASITDFGAVGNGATDDTAAFQAAIDSGKPTVYIPPTGFFIINGDVILRGNVRRLTGTHANIGGSGRIILGEGNAPAVVIERSGYPNLVHQGNRTLIISSCEVSSVTSTSAAKLFIEDLVTAKVDLQNPRQRIWARQLNTENGEETNVINAGAALWILGYKIERGQVKIETRNGGFTEVLGAHIYSTTGPKTTPLFTIDDASASFACVAETNFSSSNYIDWVREKRGPTTLVLADSAVPFRTSGNGRATTLFTGFDGAPKRPLDLAASAVPSGIALAWNDQSWDESGFQIERSPDGTTWSPLATVASNSTSFIDTTAAPGTPLHYRLRALNPTAASAPTASVQITSLSLFQIWLDQQSLPVSSNPADDTDRDGLPLLLEYALGGTPTLNDSSRLPVAARSGNQFTLSYSRLRGDLLYRVEKSADLSPSSWSEAGVDQGPPGLNAVASVPLGPIPHQFLRLRISFAP